MLFTSHTSQLFFQHPHVIKVSQFFLKFFMTIYFWQIFLFDGFCCLTNFFVWRNFFTNFLTYNLLTIASFRIGVPSILFFLQNWKNGNRKKIVIYIITFDPIEIFIDWAHQNDRQNLSFVKARRWVTEEVPAVGFCLGSGLFGSYNSD